MLLGDFMAGGEDDPWQVIPSEWIRLSQERWQETPRPKAKLDAMGCDPSRGGRDETVLARRFGDWFDTLVVLPGQEVPDGPKCAALVVQNIRDGAPVFVDVIGIGSSVVDHLKDNGVNVTGVNGAEAGQGQGRDILGHPLEALAWLANLKAPGDASRGTGLAAGEIVMLGSVVETKWLARGAVVEVEIESLGTARAVFE